MKKIINTLLFFLISLTGFSQDVEMADGMRASGKIYVVVAILLIIVAGLIGYLVMIDRKTSRLEKKLDGKNH